MSKMRICPPKVAEMWTNTRVVGAREKGSKWDNALLCDIAYVAGSNPATIKQIVRDLLRGLVTK